MQDRHLKVLMKLYHYCSNAAFLSIVQRKQIWLSELALSNDPMEGRWLREVFQECCTARELPRSQQDLLLDELDSVIEFTSAAGFCMSEEGDLLSQWRAYADNGGGVSIGFNDAYLDAISECEQAKDGPSTLVLSRVEYDEDRHRAAINPNLGAILNLVEQGALGDPSLMIGISQTERERRDNLRDELSTQFLMYLLDLFTIKNPAFREELEWRLILCWFKSIRSAKLPELNFSAKDDRVIPYFCIDIAALEIPAIVEVVIGPRNITPTPVIEQMLQKWGWQSVSVRRSTATYR